MRLKDKVAIITGGSQGIGREYALRFAREGAKIVIGDIREAQAQEVVQEIAKLGSEGLALRVDVSKEEDTKRLAAATHEKFGRIDILLNNAAIFGDMELDDRSLEYFNKILSVNLTGVWLCSRAVEPYMKRQRKGKIIHQSSTAAYIGNAGVVDTSDPDLPSPAPHYSVAKIGVSGLTKYMAGYLGPWGINRLRTWRETGYALVALPLGIAWFSIFLTLLTTSLSLIVFVIGLPLLALTMWIARGAASAQRLVAAGLLDLHIPEPPTVPPADARWFRRFVDPVLQLSTWRALVYLLVFAFPLGLASFLVAVISWSVALSLVTAPIRYLAVPADERGDVFWNGNQLDAGWEWALVVVGGAAAAPGGAVARPRLRVGATRCSCAACVGPTRRRAGARGRAQAGSERDLAVADGRATSGRQIERDLHDGAQARLVALAAVDLGRARRRLEDGGSRGGGGSRSSAAAQEEAQTRAASRSATSRAACTRPILTEPRPRRGALRAGGAVGRPR